MIIAVVVAIAVCGKDTRSEKNNVNNHGYYVDNNKTDNSEFNDCFCGEGFLVLPYKIQNKTNNRKTERQEFNPA